MEKFRDNELLITAQVKRKQWKGFPTSWILLAVLIVLVVTLPTIWYLHYLEMKQTKGKHVFIWESKKFGFKKYNGTTNSIISQKDSDEERRWRHLKNESDFDGQPNNQCDAIEDNLRFDCHPENGASKAKCESRGCCWVLPKKKYKAKSPNSLGVPYCFYPKDYPSYYIVNQTATPRGFAAFLARNGSSYYPNDIKLLKFEASVENKYRIRIRIYDPLSARYEIPYQLQLPTKDTLSAEQELNFAVNDPLSIEIKHKASNKTVFFLNTVGGFIYTDQFIQISGLLPGKYVYGLGERRDRFLRSIDWQRYTMHATDQHPVSNSNLYGSHPFMLIAGSNPKDFAVGVLLYNSNSMDVILQPAPAYTFRTIGGILDILTIIAPTSAEVISQYTEAIGRPLMPPYWALGFQLCRYGYNSTSATRQVWENTRKAGIPFDVQWNDIDYMDNRRDFTYDKKNYDNLPQFVDEVHKAGMHYVVMVDAGLDAPKDPSSYPPYADALKRGILVNDTNGKPFVGNVWSPNGAVWPDFTNPKTTTFWTDQISKFHQQIPFDGIWIDMNEPSNFYDGTKTGCPSNSTYENPPYVPGVAGGTLRHHTVCMTARQHASIHYNVHNLFGLSEAIATNKALRSVLPGKRPFIISRSTFPGQGHYSGHWSGDISSTWDDMRKSIPAILDFNLFGIPMVGADICGFTGNTTPELCQRWMELGAFYPFSRNHNDIGSIPQDPVSLGEGVVTASRFALNYRYRLLPYLYTLFYRAHVFGETVARPLFFEFQDDQKTYPIDTQFMWGPALMILPVLDENVTILHSYFPAGRWYKGTNPVPFDSTGNIYDLSAPPEIINFAFRGGYIIPFKQDSNTTTESRNGWFGIVVCLDASGDATGELYWDDGESLDVIDQGKYNLINFTSHSNVVQSKIARMGAASELTDLQTVIVYGVEKAPTVVEVNGKKVDFNYDKTIKSWAATKFAVSMREPFTITWS